MQTDELKGLHAEPELSGVAARVNDDCGVNVAPKSGRQKEEEEEESCSAAQ